MVCYKILTLSRFYYDYFIYLVNICLTTCQFICILLFCIKQRLFLRHMFHDTYFKNGIIFVTFSKDQDFVSLISEYNKYTKIVGI